LDVLRPPHRRALERDGIDHLRREADLLLLVQALLEDEELMRLFRHELVARGRLSELGEGVGVHCSLIIDQSAGSVTWATMNFRTSPTTSLSSRPPTVTGAPKVTRTRAP